MATKQAIVSGLPSPVYLNETGTNDTILLGVYVDQTSPSGTVYAQTISEAGTASDAPAAAARVRRSFGTIIGV